MVIYMDFIFSIYKPKDYTSRDIVNIVSKKMNTKKVGHTGTLDPLAEGILIICGGKYTKISDLITSYNKEYVAEIRFGFETDTLDITGEKLVFSENLVKKEELIETLKYYSKKYNQEVPIFSAVKVDGRKLYEYARSKKKVVLPKKEVEIFNIELLDFKDNYAKIKCLVSKGTYIRSLIRDIGRSLDNYAIMESLIRTKQGGVDSFNTLQDLEDGNMKYLDFKKLINIPIVKVSKELEVKIKNGAVVDKFFEGQKVMVINESDELIAIYKEYEKDLTKSKPEKVFNT